MTRFVVSLFALILLVPATLAQPASPDATPIPAVYYVSDSYNYHVATLDPKTFEPTEICTVDGFSLTNARPAQSPDGTKLALTLLRGNFAIADYSFLPHQKNSFIYLCDLASGEAEKLSLPDEDVLDSSASFSPDGTKLVWLRVVQLPDSDDVSDVGSQIVIYDLEAATETVITTLNTVPFLGITGEWLHWGPGGIALSGVTSDVDDGRPPFAIYDEDGTVLASVDPFWIPPINRMYEWATVGEEEAVFILTAEPPAEGNRQDRYTVLNPATGEIETLAGNPNKGTIPTDPSLSAPIFHFAAPLTRQEFVGQYLNVGLIYKRYHSRYDLAISPDERNLLFIEFTSIPRGGLLYYVDSFAIGEALGAYGYPVTQITIPDVKPGLGGAIAVYWEPRTWHFNQRGRG